MSTQLIVNADDFGLTPGINRRVGELHRAGVLTSTTLMANGPAFDDAVNMATTLPTLGVGCHVVLTDGLPLLPASSASSLLDRKQEQFRSSLSSFARAALSGRLDEDQLEAEIAKQVERLLSAGITPSHLDTHKHTHIFPAVLRPLVRVAVRYGIGAIRNPFEQPWSLGLGHGPLLRRLQIRLLGRFEGSFNAEMKAQNGRVQTTLGAVGVAATGVLNQRSLAQLLAKLPAGRWELVCHPGVNDAALLQASTRLRQHREIESEALLSVVPNYLQQTQDVELISFRDLPSSPSSVPKGTTVHC